MTYLRVPLSLVAVAVILFGVGGCAHSAGPVTDTAARPVLPDKVWFTGSSNIRHFSCRSTSVSVFAEAAPEEIERTKADGVPAVRSAALAIPVRSLDCGINKMNRDLFETLGGDKKSTISFSLWNYVVLKRGSEGSVRMNGLLRLAGTEKMLVLYGVVYRDVGGAVRLKGDRDIDVREFGISPPRRFLGLFHVRREVTVHFDVAVRPLIDPLGTLASFNPSFQE